MYEEKQNTAHRCIRQVTSLAILINISLSVVKLTVGLLAGSASLIADGIHSISDTSTDFGILLGIRLSSKEPDKSHHYGHGRAETFTALFIALVLLIVAGGMINYAALDIVKQRIVKPQLVILIVALVSIVGKELLYRLTKKTAIKFQSTALYANAWHQRSDALSSIAVVIGFVSLKFGFRYGDQVAAIAVGVMIILVAVRIIGDCFGELTERAVDAETYNNIKSIIKSNEQIRQWHKLRTRTVGRELFLDLHILVDPDLNIANAHEIAETLENTLDNQLSRPVNVTVHIEPDLPELRK